MTILRGMGHLATKVSMAFFAGIEVLNIFYFFEKKAIFSKVSPKITFRSITIFKNCKILKMFFSKLYFFTFQL